MGNGNLYAIRKFEHASARVLLRMQCRIKILENSLDEMEWIPLNKSLDRHEPGDEERDKLYGELAHQLEQYSKAFQRANLYSLLINLVYDRSVRLESPPDQSSGCAYRSSVIANSGNVYKPR